MSMKNILLIITDLVIVLFGYLFAVFLRFELTQSAVQYLIDTRTVILIVLLIHFIFYKVFKTDKSVWSRISVDEAVRVVAANFSAMLSILVLNYFEILPMVSWVVIIIAFLVVTLVQEIIRFSYRLYRVEVLKRNRIKNHSKRVLIYGAGNAGNLIAKEVLESSDYNEQIIGFIDDNTDLAGKTIMGIPIFGGKDTLRYIIEQHSIDEIVVAMPSTPLKIQNEIIQHCISLNMPVRTVASVQELLRGGKLQHTLRKIEIADLLERQEILIDDLGISHIIKGKTILVTGAGGSIGSELVRQIIKFEPKKLLMFDISETGLYSIQQELNMMKRENKIKLNNSQAFIGSIRDYETLETLFKNETIQVVFHAAAYKHVPLMEDAPKEAIRNNIFGTRNLIELSDRYQVERFINISTDKAVNPTNVMGATKRFNEMMLQSKNGTTKTKFTAVRFGNVLGSNGSVVPLFQKQIERGGPVTVTHPDIIRYFMTIPEAVSLVLQAATYAKGGEIFVLNMGDPVKITKLAENVIKLSGFEPYKDIDIEFTGLRPGEKLFEELLMAEEGLVKTDNELIFIANPLPFEQEVIDHALRELEQVCNNHKKETVVLKLKEVVPTYKEVAE